MAEETIEIGASLVSIGPSRRKCRPDDRVERLTIEPGGDRSTDADIRIRRVECAVALDQSADPTRSHVGGNLLANRELGNGLFEAPNSKPNPMSLDFSCHRIDDQRDPPIECHP